MYKPFLTYFFPHFYERSDWLPSLIVSSKEQVLELVPHLHHVRQKRDALLVLLHNVALLINALFDEEDVDVSLVNTYSHSLNRGYL